MPAFRPRHVLPSTLALALLALSMGAVAREVRHQGPNGDGGDCPIAAAEAETGTPAPARRAADPRGKAKASPMVRGSGGNDGEGATARPRWHSFLPGMFR